MADEADSASDQEQLDRDVAIRNFLNRKRAPTPVCAECGEASVHVTSIGCAWRVCWDCAQDLLAAKAEAA